MSVIAPSGEQIEIEHGDQRAVVTGVGAGLRAYSVGGRDVVNGYGVDEMATAGRGQVLIPWPNRLQDGQYEFEGRGISSRSPSPSTQTRFTALSAGRPGAWLPARPTGW